MLFRGINGAREIIKSLETGLTANLRSLVKFYDSVWASVTRPFCSYSIDLVLLD